MKPIEQFQDYYQAELLPHLEQLEAKRLQIVSRVKTVAIATAAIVLLIALGAATFAQASASFGAPPVFAAIIVCVIGAVIFAVIYSQMTRGFVGEFKESIIGRIVRFVGPDLSYHKDDCIRQPAYMGSQIFLTHPDRYRGEDMVRGKVGQTEIQFSEVHSEYKTESVNKDGKRTVTWHTIFRGIFFIADFNKHFHGETVVLPDMAEKMFGRFGQTLQSWNLARRGELVRLEDVEFERHFVVYADDQVEARYLLSTSLMARIVDFVKGTGKQVHLSFVGSNLYVAISYSKDLFEPKLFTSLLDIKVAQEYLSDLLLAVSIVEDLNLNTRIWTKQ